MEKEEMYGSFGSGDFGNINIYEQMARQLTVKRIFGR